MSSVIFTKFTSGGIREGSRQGTSEAPGVSDELSDDLNEVLADDWLVGDELTHVISGSCFAV